MTASTELGVRTLGVIWPIDRDGRVDYEGRRFGPWLEGRGVAGVRARTEISKAGNGHFRDALFETGDVARLRGPARRLVAAGAEVILWACTSGSFIGGLEWARAQVAELGAAVGAPVTSTTLALIEAGRALGATRLDILGAYPEPVTTELGRCLAQAGFQVGEVAALDTPDGENSFALDVRREMRAFVAACGPGDHPIVLPDTAINSLDLVEELEAIAGRPVIAANQATLWQGLRLLGLDVTIPEAGTLFRLPMEAGAEHAAESARH